jgi:hypothetical protein
MFFLLICHFPMLLEKSAEILVISALFRFGDALAFYICVTKKNTGFASLLNEFRSWRTGRRSSVQGLSMKKHILKRKIALFCPFSALLLYRCQQLTNA